MLAGPALALALTLQLPQALEPAPGTTYDPAIPTLEEVVGHDFGEEVTSPPDIVRYLEALAEAAPERTLLIHYGATWEGRPLVMLAVGSAGNMARLDEIKAGLGRLADPRGLDDDEAERLIADLPTVVALMHGVHGNEISSSGAALTQAYHLLAATNDPRTDEIRQGAIVLIDPSENPDGRARFVFNNRVARAASPDPNPLAAEHQEPWPGGRSNHYLFDLNRDWFIQSQPETRGRAATLLDWHPQVVVDLHEMGGNSTYFFPPPADPISPWITSSQRAQWDLMGESIAGAFDERGFPYFNAESYDAFYPGYGDSWPMGHGAVAMTFEQASARGLVFDRTDGTQLTYNRGVVQHFTAALATAHAAALNRERLLRDFLAFHRSALEVGDDRLRYYALTSDHDPAMAQHLAQVLVRNGIEVLELEAPLEVDDRVLGPQAAFLVPLEQPASRLVRNLLDPDVPMDPVFYARQVERLANRLPHEMYDVTAWSLPALFDVEALGLTSDPGVQTRRMELDASVVAGGGPSAQVAYLMPWGTATAATVAQATREGLSVHAAGAEFVLGGRTFPIGTAVLRAPLLSPDQRDRLYEIASIHGAEVVAVNTGYVEDGISLGSNQVRFVPPGRVALAWDEPTRSLSAGWARYVLERRYGHAVTAIRTRNLQSAPDLSSYDVIVLPSGDYSDAFNPGFLTRLQSWMRAGGTLVTLARATEWAADAGLLETSAESRMGEPAGGADEDAADGEEGATGQGIDYLDAIQPDEEDPITISGSILNGILDTDHWLSSGTDGQVGVLVEGTRIFTPLTLDDGTNVGRYASGDSLVASGIVWEQSRAQFMNKAFLMHQSVGQGHLIAFAEDPNYRAYTEASMLLFMNAVLLGPAF